MNKLRFIPDPYDQKRKRISQARMSIEIKDENMLHSLDELIRFTFHISKEEWDSLTIQQRHELARQATQPDYYDDLGNPIDEPRSQK